MGDRSANGPGRRQVPGSVRSGLGLLLALALVRGLLYAMVTPPWQAPDETGHFEYAWLIAHLGRLPSREDLSPEFERELLASLYEWRYGEFIGLPLPQTMPTRLEDLPSYIHAQRSRTVVDERLSLAYLWQALFLLPVRAQDLAFQLLLARFSSVLLNLGIVWLSFRTFREIMPGHPKTAVAMALGIVLMPQHTFINGTVGDGTMAELMACLVLYCWVRLFRCGVRAGEAAGIIAGTFAGVLSKTTALFLVPLNVGLALWWLLRERRQPRSRRRLVYLCIILVAVGLGVWLWSRSAMGSSTLSAITNLQSRPEPAWVDGRGLALDEALIITSDSFWANFGWMTLPVSSRWYGAILLLVLLATLGWVMRLSPAGRFGTAWGDGSDRVFPPWVVGILAASFFTALIVFVWVAILFPSGGLYQTQGRYLFPAVIPAVFLLAGGWLRLLPSRHQPVLLVGILFLVVFDAWCLLGTVIPYFYYR